MAAGGAYAYGSYPDIDGLFREQAAELDPQAARGHPAPDPAAHARQGDLGADLAELASMNGVGPRVDEFGHRAHRRLRLLRALRRHHAQGEVTLASGGSPGGRSPVPDERIVSNEGRRRGGRLMTTISPRSEREHTSRTVSKAFAAIGPGAIDGPAGLGSGRLDRTCPPRAARRRRGRPRLARPSPSPRPPRATRRASSPGPSTSRWPRPGSTPRRRRGSSRRSWCSTRCTTRW